MADGKTILIAGGTGMIGSALSSWLIASGYRVIILSRKPLAPGSNQQFALWNTETLWIDRDAIVQADFILNLAGAGVAEKRWTKARKKEILESRTASGATIVKALKEYPHKVKAVINISGIGWYGPDPAIPNMHPFTEEMNAFGDYLGQTCQQWEKSIEPVAALGTRLVVLRTGIVLSREGGAWVEFRKPMRFGMATILGSGRQQVSWIHIDDLCRVFQHAIEQEAMKGIYNVVSPYPVSNKALILELARQSGTRFFLPIRVPAFLLKIIVGEMSVEVLKSATVSCAKLIQTGFSFTHPTIQEAIRALYGRS